MSVEKIEKMLDFLIVREEWSKYRVLNDETMAKVKLILTAIRETGQEGKFHYSLKATFIKDPSSSDAKTSAASTATEEPLVEEEVPFEKVSEPINIYDIPEKFILLTKPILSVIKRTNKFDSKGNRVYNIKLDCAVNVVKYP